MKQGWCCPRSKLLIGIPNGHPHNHANEAEGAELQTSRLQNPVYVHIYSIHLKVATIVGLFGKKCQKLFQPHRLIWDIRLQQSLCLKHTGNFKCVLKNPVT